MDAQQFLAEFGHIANAPGGITQIRQLVLQLAISGLLTNRQPNDIDANSLINENLKAQDHLIAKKQLKRQPSPKGIDKSEVPWLLPEGWAWVRLGTVTNYGDAPKLEYSNVTEDTWVLELEDIEKCTSRLLLKVTARERKFKSTKNGFPANSVLYGKLRPYLDKVLIADTSGVCTTEISPISFFDRIEAGYLRWYLKSPYFIAYANGATYGMNLPRVSTDTVREALFPFPPKIEQSRIVAKVDELMALCDKLEAQQQARRKLQNNLRQSTLQAVASATSPHELQSSWARLYANFGQMFHTPEDVADFRQLTMDLAVRGFLTDQRDEDEPAFYLLARIALEHKEMVLNGEMKRPKPLPEIDLTDAPFELPRGWAWARFPEVGLFGRGKSKHRPRNDPKLFSPSIYPLVQTGEVARANSVIKEFHSKYSEIGLAQSKLWPKGTLCITIAANIADAAILGFDACFPDSVVGFIPAPELRDEVEYFLLFMKTARERLLAFAPSTAQKNINLEILQSVLIPVPPKDEIKRILSRINEINAHCDRLVDIHAKAQDIGKLLAGASVAKLTGINTE